MAGGMTTPIERGDFWEFQARTALCDLELARLRAQLAALVKQRNAIVDAFALQHGLDPQRPMVLEDADYTVTQGHDAPIGETAG